MLWRASEYSIRQSVQSAMKIVNERNFTSVAFPIIGAGSGGFKESKAKEIMLGELSKIESKAKVLLVVYSKQKA
jgi:O-acetyl-ADP-ribose deacetylase